MDKDTESHTEGKPPKCSFTISQLVGGETQRDKNLEEERKTLMDITLKNLESLNRELGESFRQKNLWLIQLITIASTIVGAFILTQQPVDRTIKIGLIILFIVISVGLALIFKENKKHSETILRAIARHIDYSMCGITYLDLKNKEYLSQREESTKQSCETYLKKFLQEMGILAEDGEKINIGGVSDNLEKNLKKFEITYILILGFLISILILITPESFKAILEYFWNKNIHF